MQINITNNCINCGACAFVCPVEAVYPPSRSWRFNHHSFQALSSAHYFIVPQICNLCAGFKILKCIEICPMNAIKTEINQIDLTN